MCDTILNLFVLQPVWIFVLYHFWYLNKTIFECIVLLLIYCNELGLNYHGTQGQALINLVHWPFVFFTSLAFLLSCELNRTIHQAVRVRHELTGPKWLT